MASLKIQVPATTITLLKVGTSGSSIQIAGSGQGYFTTVVTGGSVPAQEEVNSKISYGNNFIPVPDGRDVYFYSNSAAEVIVTDDVSFNKGGGSGSGTTVEEVATFGDLPAIGNPDVIYLTLDTNKLYRWGGTVYVEISSSLALGETSSSAYRGDRGKIAYDHSLIEGNPHNTFHDDLRSDNTYSGATVPPLTFVISGIEAREVIQDVIGITIQGLGTYNGKLKTSYSTSLNRAFQEFKFMTENGELREVTRISTPLTDVTPSWNNWIVSFEGNTLSMRRTPTSPQITMATNVPLTLPIDSLVLGTNDFASKVSSTVFKVRGGRKYGLAISGKYVQLAGSTSTATITLQYSNDGITGWTNTLLSRQVSLEINNEIIDNTLEFTIYPQELPANFGERYYRLLPTAVTTNGISYAIAIEIKELFGK